MRPTIQKLWNRLLLRNPQNQLALQRRQNRRRRLEVEVLEDRCLLSATASGLITGVAFVDANGSGVHDAGEATLPGVPVALAGTTTTGTPVSVSTSTDANGAYTFNNVLPGTYQVSGGAASGFATENTNVFGGLTITSDQSITQDFAFRGLNIASISLRLFLTTSTPNDVPHDPAGTGSGLANYRPNNAPVLQTAIADVSEPTNSADTTIDLAANFTDPDLASTTVQLNTSGGTMNIQLFDATAPQTVANFLDYVQSGAYNNSIFHRLSSGFVLQGGGFTFNSSSSTITTIPTLPTVQNEFGASNTLGTLAMAKVGSDPNSATDQFFVNLADNSSNLDSQNGGFTVFGKLASAADQTVVNNLVNPPVAVMNESSSNSAFDTIPLVNYTGTNFPTDTTAANYDLINSAVITNQDEVLSYSVVSNSNTGLVTASITNERLTLHYTAGQTGSATITVRATDRYGASVDASFNVTVANQPPSTTVALNTASPLTNDTLTATATPTDPDSEPVTLTYVWKVNGNIVKTTTDTSSTTDTLDLSQAGNGDSGDVITVEVTPKDSALTGAKATATATVQNSAPTATVVLNPNPPETNDTLTATTTAADADGDPVSLTYVWSVNGAIVKTTTSTSSTTDTLDLSQAGNGDTGDTVQVLVTPNDGKVNGAQTSASVTVS